MNKPKNLRADIGHGICVKFAELGEFSTNSSARIIDIVYDNLVRTITKTLQSNIHNSMYTSLTVYCRSNE